MDYRSAVKAEVSNVKALIKEMLRKKMELAEYKQDKQKEAMGSPATDAGKNNFGAYYNRLLDEMREIASELAVSPSSDTVRRVRALLVEARGKMPMLTSGEVKMVLDKLFELGGYASVKKYSSKAKAYEAQELIKENVARFVSENAAKYLGSDAYPASVKEAAPEFQSVAKQAKEAVEKDEKKRVARKGENARDAWFSRFKNNSDLMYVLIAFAKANFMPDDRIANVRAALVNDADLLQRTKDVVYEDAIEKRNSPASYVSALVPEVKQMEAAEAAPKEAMYTVAQLKEFILSRMTPDEFRETYGKSINSFKKKSELFAIVEELVNALDA